MKKMKVVSLLLAAVMLTSACSKAKPTTKNAKDEPVSLKYYMFGSENAMQGSDEVFSKANEIIKEKINAEVEFTILSGAQFEQKIPILMASGEDFDLMFTSSWLNSYLGNVSKGALLELDELLPQYAPELYAQIKPEIWDAARVNGKIYAVINEQIMARQSAFVFSDQYLKLTGFDPETITTFKDIDKYFQLLEEKGVNKTEIDYTGSSLEWIYTVQQEKGWETLASQNVPGVIDDTSADCKVFNQFTSDAFKEYIALTHKWYEQGFMHTDNLTSQGTLRKPMALRATGTYIPALWKEAELPVWNGITDLVIKPYGETFLTTSNVIATMTGIYANSKNPESAMQYLNLVNTDKALYNLLTKGIEGRDYDKVSENRIAIKPDSLYTPNSDWAFGNQFNAYLTGDMEEDSWEQQRKYNDEAPRSPLVGFSFDNTNVQTEIANCEAIVGEYILLACYGLLDPEANYIEFINKLEAAGADKIIAEMQSQVDAFLKK